MPCVRRHPIQANQTTLQGLVCYLCATRDYYRLTSIGQVPPANSTMHAMLLVQRRHRCNCNAEQYCETASSLKLQGTPRDEAIKAGHTAQILRKAVDTSLRTSSSLAKTQAKPLLVLRVSLFSCCSKQHTEIAATSHYLLTHARGWCFFCETTQTLTNTSVYSPL